MKSFHRRRCAILVEVRRAKALYGMIVGVVGNAKGLLMFWQAGAFFLPLVCTIIQFIVDTFATFMVLSFKSAG